MGLSFSLPRFAASASSDAVKLLLDMPDGAWDQVYRAARARGWIPESATGRWAQVIALITIGCLADQQIGDGGELSRFFHEVLGKSRSDLAKRIAFGLASVKEHEP